MLEDSRGPHITQYRASARSAEVCGVFALAVLLHHLLQPFHRPGHVVRGEHRVDLHGGVHREEQGFHDGGDLRGVVNVNDVRRRYLRFLS